MFGAPFDSTTSYRPGARFASSAMRNESFGIETYSPYQDKDLTDIKVFDGGDPELCFGNPESALNDIEKLSDKIKVNQQLSNKNAENKLKQDNKNWNLNTVSGNDDGFMFI